MEGNPYFGSKRSTCGSTCLSWWSVKKIRSDKSDSVRQTSDVWKTLELQDDSMFRCPMIVSDAFSAETLVSSPRRLFVFFFKSCIFIYLFRSFISHFFVYVKDQSVLNNVLFNLGKSFIDNSEDYKYQPYHLSKHSTSKTGGEKNPTKKAVPNWHNVR